MAHNSLLYSDLPWRLTWRLIISKSLESFGFSIDHPHTTYLKVLKTLFFGGGGQLNRDLKIIRRSTSIKYKSELCERRERGATLPLPPSLQLREGELLKSSFGTFEQGKAAHSARPFQTCARSLKSCTRPAPLRLFKTLPRQHSLSRVLTTSVSLVGVVLNLSPRPASWGRTGRGNKFLSGKSEKMDSTMN